MWVYGLLLGTVFVLLVISSIYIVRLTHNTIKKYFSNKLLSWIISLIPLLLFVPGLFIDMVNAIVVDIHLIVIVAITKLIFYIIKKITKKEINELLVLSCGVIITSIIMVYAYYVAHNVKETDYVVYTTKDIGVENYRIVQISDSHLGTTMDGKKFSEYMLEINELNPDVVVVTGDFVDDDTSYEDMKNGASGLGLLQTKDGVYFIYGNHDKGYFNRRNYNDDDIKRELRNNNVIILEDAYLNLSNNIFLIGRSDAEVKDRATAKMLTENMDKDKYIIMLDHQPNDYENEMKAGVDLVLLGHTHGGQLFPLGQIGLLLGANDKVYGMETRDNTTFIVNSGISDWAIKFKTGTIAEYTVIDIKRK